MKAVILAGGEGKRLRPYTEIVPKPLLPVNGKAILHIILERLKEQGVNEVILTINYLSYLFRTLFGDGSKLGMKIEYSEETEPLGTCGPIKLVEEKLNEPFFVMNGDLITDLDLRDVEKFHKETNSDMTVVTKEVETLIPFGVIQAEGEKIIGLKEKPKIMSEVNAGMYMINPSVLKYVPKNKFYNMTDLIADVIKANGKVSRFIYKGEWTDVGLLEDYEKANLNSSKK